MFRAIGSGMGKSVHAVRNYFFGSDLGRYYDTEIQANKNELRRLNKELAAEWYKTRNELWNSRMFRFGYVDVGRILPTLTDFFILGASSCSGRVWYDALLRVELLRLSMMGVGYLYRRKQRSNSAEKLIRGIDYNSDREENRTRLEDEE